MNDQERNEEEQRENESDNQLTLSANKLNVVDGEVVVLTFSNHRPECTLMTSDINVFHNGDHLGFFDGGSFVDKTGIGRYSMVKLDSNNWEFKINPFKAEADVGKWTMYHGWYSSPTVLLSEKKPTPLAPVDALAPLAPVDALALLATFHELGNAITIAVTGVVAYCLVHKWRPKNVDTNVAVEEALQRLKNNNLIDDFKKHEVKIMEVLKKSAKTEEKLTKEMFRMVDKKSVEDVEIEMSAIIGQDRVQLIKNAFCIETYQMKLVKKSDGQTFVQMHRGGAQFRPDKHLNTIPDIDDSHIDQWTSIVVEIVFLVLSCVDISVNLDNDEMRVLVQEVEGYVRLPAFERARITFLEKWNQGGNWGRAKAIFNFLKDTYTIGIFWKIVKLIKNDWSTWKSIRAVAEIELMIVAAFATEGLALIARIALAVNSAVYLVPKLINISKFIKTRKTL